jgi:hypothetical protein
VARFEFELGFHLSVLMMLWPWESMASSYGISHLCDRHHVFFPFRSDLAMSVRKDLFLVSACCYNGTSRTSSKMQSTMNFASR